MSTLGMPATGDPLAPIPGISLGTSTIQTTVRPRRLAFAVHEGDAAGFTRAVLAASTIWGGARCPILMVDESGRVAPALEQLAECIGIDEIVDLQADLNTPLTFTGSALSRVRALPERPLEDSKFWAPHPLAVTDPEQVSSLRILRGTGWGVIGLAALGDVELDLERDWWSREGASFVESQDDGDFALAQVNHDSVLAATLNRDVDHAISNPMMLGMGLLVVAEDENDLETAVWFWNLRALRPRGWNQGAASSSPGGWPSPRR